MQIKLAAYSEEHNTLKHVFKPYKSIDILTSNFVDVVKSISCPSQDRPLQLDTS